MPSFRRLCPFFRFEGSPEKNAVPHFFELDRLNDDRTNIYALNAGPGFGRDLVFFSFCDAHLGCVLLWLTPALYHKGICRKHTLFDEGILFDGMEFV